MVDFTDGSSNIMNPKFLSLVAEEAGAATNAMSEHHEVGKRAKTRTPSSEKEDAAEEGESEESEEQSQEEEDERSDFDYDEEGGQEEHHHVRERAKAGAPSKGKKRAAPAGASTSKAAKKKKKTSASAFQVQSERNTAGANVERTGVQPTQCDPQNLIWLHMIRTGGIVRDEGFGVQGGLPTIGFRKLVFANLGKSKQA